MADEQKPETISFTVSGMPKHLFEKFKEFARTETGDCYWLAIEKLMMKAEEDWKYNVLIEEINSLKYRVNELEKNRTGEEEVKTFKG